MPSTDARRGFTLAESLVASVVLAIAVVGVSGALIAAKQQTQAQEDDAVAVTVGKQLLEEIVSFPLVLSDGTTGQPGWPSVTDRATYDTVDDFAGYRDMISSTYERERAASGSEDLGSLSARPAVTVIDPLNTPSNLANWEYRREVSVTYPTSVFGSTVAAGDLVLVAVKVTTASGRLFRFTKLIARTPVVR
jgi:prepilin-type N-terminal cleavage/methylation domain-containing protein